MAVITLTTDFGLKDHYVAAVKGALISGSPAHPVVDVSHLIPPGDILQASFVLRHCFREFPKGSIHVVGVGTTLSQRYPHIVLRLEDHLFIGCDNGLFSLLSSERPSAIVEIGTGTEPLSFVVRDLYVPAVIRLTAGETLEQLGETRNDIFEKLLLRHPPQDDQLNGSVIYVDAFGNLITDITRETFSRIGKGRPFSIEIVGDEITEIHGSYSEVIEGEKLALFNSSGLLEIAINQGKAVSLLNLKLNSVVRIRFEA